MVAAVFQFRQLRLEWQKASSSFVPRLNFEFTAHARRDGAWWVIGGLDTADDGSVVIYGPVSHIHAIEEGKARNG